MFGLWWFFIGAVILASALFIIASKQWDGDVMWFLGGVATFAAAILFVCCIAIPISARREITEFQYTKEMVGQVVASGSDYENIALSGKVIEMNVWLSEAKARKDVLGGLCAYDQKALDALTPITLP